jgi:hypothetical protein
MQYRVESAPPIGPWGGPPPRGGGTPVGFMFKGETPLDPLDACVRLIHLRWASPSHMPLAGAGVLRGRRSPVVGLLVGMGVFVLQTLE